MKREYELERCGRNSEQKTQLRQICRKCFSLFLTGVIGRNKYTIKRDKNAEPGSSDDICSLKKVNKISDAISPMEALVLNFCHTIEDIKILQKQPEKLDFLKLSRSEIEAMLTELLFIFEKKQCLKIAGLRIEKKRNRKKRTDSCCEHF